METIWGGFFFVCLYNNINDHKCRCYNIVYNTNKNSKNYNVNVACLFREINIAVLKIFNKRSHLSCFFSGFHTCMKNYPLFTFVFIGYIKLSWFIYIYIYIHIYIITALVPNRVLWKYLNCSQTMV